jgi:hypothetical protein
MATTRLMPLHARGKTIAAALGRTTAYVSDKNKTQDGEYILTYQCDELTVTEEFLFSKRQYELTTGRKQDKEHDVIAYHLRQSFKPGEISPELAGKVAYDTMMSLTKGKHAFIICVHVDKKHIHCHSIFNSTALDCKSKFRNFWGSTFAVRKISDVHCLTNGLSVIENPKRLKGSYADWLGEKPMTAHDKLRKLIDENIIIGRSYEEFLVRLKKAGVEMKFGKQLAFKLPDGKRFMRQDSLGGGYDYKAICDKLNGSREIPSWLKQQDDDADRKTAEYVASKNKPSFLIDIQKKISEGAGEGYRQWMAIFNIKQCAKTLIYLKEQGIDSFDDLRKRYREVSGKYNGSSTRLREISARQKEITELQKQIGTYQKTRAVFDAYKKSKWSKKFYAEHEDEIIRHKAAKKYFDEHGSATNGKLPSINQLKQEWAALEAERRTLWRDYNSVKAEHRDLLVAYENAKNILGVNDAGDVVAPMREIRNAYDEPQRGKSCDIGGR